MKRPAQKETNNFRTESASVKMTAAKKAQSIILPKSPDLRPAELDLSPLNLIQLVCTL